jgi:TonB family protein
MSSCFEMTMPGLASALHLSVWEFFPCARRPVPLAALRRRVASVVLGFGLATIGAALLCSSPAQAQAQAQEQVKTEPSRKVMAKDSPVYPEAARRSNIVGTVRLAVVIAPNGSVKSAKPLGGHPLLVDAALDAMKQWKFEVGPNETGGVVEFKFKP